MARCGTWRADECSGGRPATVPPLQLRPSAARVWEKQKRGLAHLHGVISVESPAHVRWAEAYVTSLREMAPRYRFGFVDGWHKVGRKFWPGVEDPQLHLRPV